MIDAVNCPYCGKENDMSNALDDGVPDSYKMDWECQFCKKELEVDIEFEARYNSSKIEYVICGLCEAEVRDDFENCRKRGSTTPYPTSVSVDVICTECYNKNIFKTDKI